LEKERRLRQSAEEQVKNLQRLLEEEHQTPSSSAASSSSVLPSSIFLLLFLFVLLFFRLWAGVVSTTLIPNFYYPGSFFSNSVLVLGPEGAIEGPRRVIEGDVEGAL